MNWNRISLLASFVSVALSVAHGQTAKLQRVEVFPSEFSINGHRESLQLVVTGITEQGRVIDLTRNAQYATVNGNGSVSEDGIVHGIQDGVEKVTVSTQGLSAETQVAVKNSAHPQPVSFDFHALPILAQTGCSGGSCHGSPHGKAGFRLSLFASDRELDRQSLTRELFGRRINVLEPEKSLLLAKPTTTVAHQGGKRFSEDTKQYRLLRDWIAEGADTESSDVTCVGIEVYPKAGRTLHFPNKQQQLSVIATFSDQSKRDVTQLTTYEVSDPLVASVSQTGLVTGLDRGDVVVITRFLNFIETSHLTFVRDIEGFTWAAPEPANYVDRLVHQKLQQLQFLPASLATEEEFLRRVYLDVLGRLPNEEERLAHLNNTAQDRRETLIDQLLNHREHTKFWAQKWGDLLRVSTKLLGRGNAYKFSRWLEHSVATNVPYDQFARQLLLANGSTLEQPAGNFYRAAHDTSDAMETVAQVFMGTRMQCAKCHNHPLERWTQENYYGLSAFFNRLQRSPGTSREENVSVVRRARRSHQPCDRRHRTSMGTGVRTRLVRER